MPGPLAPGPTEGPAVPPTLTTAATLVILEGIVLIALGVLEAASLTGGRLTMGLTTTAFFLAAGAGLIACAWGLRRLVRTARGPAMMAQLLCLGMAWSFRGGDTTLVSIGLAVVAGITIVGLLHPDSTAALEAADSDG